MSRDTSVKSSGAAALGRGPVLGAMMGLWERVRALPGWLQGVGAAGIALGTVGLIFFLGFVSGERAVGPAYPLFAKVTNKLDDMFFRGGPPPPLESTIYNSALVRLSAEVGTVDTGRPADDRNMLSRNGGGLASLGDDVLLLPYNGKIYAASGPDDIRETAIIAPDNNRAQYLETADDPAFSEYQFHRGYLRYNDLMVADTPTGQYLIASYTEFHQDEACVTNTLARLPLPAGVSDVDQISASADDWDILFRTEPCLGFKTSHLAMEGHMAAGRIAFSAPSTIYMTSGDFHIDGMRSEGPGIAQDPDAMYGKTLAIDINTGEGRIESMGHRNAQGIVATPAGDVMVIEHGPRGGDEINLIKTGANYGWPLESYGTTYRGTPIPNSVSYGRHTQSEPPIHSWVPSIAVSGAALIDGFNDSWNGDLLVSSLTDMSLWRVRMENGDAIYDERIEIGSRIRYVHQHTDGQIVLWTDNGELIFLSAMERVDEGERFQRWLSEADLSARVKRELNTVMDRCAECHSFQVGDHEKAPGLNKIFGDDIAATSYAGYSDGLRAVSGKWTRENLATYLDDPQGFAPGSVMPASGIEDPATTQALIDYLESLDRAF